MTVPSSIMPGFRSLMSSTPSAKVAVLKFRARVAARLFQFGDDVAHGRQAEALVDEGARIERLQRSAVAHQRAQIAAAGGDDLLGDAVGFRMHRRSIERLAAVRDAQEAGALLEGALVQAARTFSRSLRLAKRPCRIAMRDDGFGERRAEAGHARQQRRRSGVEIDADGIHRVFDHRFQRAAEPVLVDIVLILADADRFRLDLDQFGQRILQAPRDRDRAAQRHVEVGEFRRRRRRGRIDRGAGLADDHLERLRRRGMSDSMSATSFSVSRLPVPLPIEISSTLCLRNQRGELGLRAAHIVPRLETDRPWLCRAPCRCRRRRRP